MKIPRTSTARKAGVNMTPMIDIVFLLVIFFLVSSHLVRQENQLELALPVAASSLDDKDMETPRVTISIRDDGSLWMAGRSVAVDSLSERLKELRDREGEGIEVRVRTSRELPYSFAQPVILACTDARIWNITWAVYRRDPVR